MTLQELKNQYYDELISDAKRVGDMTAYMFLMRHKRAYNERLKTPVNSE